MAEFGYHKKFRPSDWHEILGNQAAAKSFKDMLDKDDGPRVYLITGPSGCGKTTIARIGAKHLGCKGLPNLTEYNAADDRGIELVRTIKRDIQYAAQGNRCHIIDEAHQLTTQAQEAFLKVLEDGPRSDYFFICTTNPENFKPTFKRRCTPITIKPLGGMDLSDLLEEVSEEQGLNVSDAVYDLIVDMCEGSPAIALNALESVAHLDEVEAMQKLKDDSSMAAASAPSNEIGELIKGIFWGKMKQPAAMKLLSEIKKLGKDSPEGIRLALVNCAGNNILAGGKGVMEISMDIISNLEDSQAFHNRSQDWAILAYRMACFFE